MVETDAKMAEYVFQLYKGAVHDTDVFHGSHCS